MDETKDRQAPRIYPTCSPSAIAIEPSWGHGLIDLAFDNLLLFRRYFHYPDDGAEEITIPLSYLSNGDQSGQDLQHGRIKVRESAC